MTSAQLLYAFQFHRDCFEPAYSNLILRFSHEYVPSRPEAYPAGLSWPAPDVVIDNLGKVARLHYPPFISPILHPDSPAIPPTFQNIAAVTSSAHPAISRLSCALLHPNEPSCLENFGNFSIHELTRVLKYVLTAYSVSALLRHKRKQQAPQLILNILKDSLRATLFITMAIGTSWGSICGLQRILPTKFLSTRRFFISGFLGGLWAVVDRENGRGRYLYSLRLSLESTWKVLVKLRYVRPIPYSLFLCPLTIGMGTFTCLLSPWA